jgi:hypothetical protein
MWVNGRQKALAALPQGNNPRYPRARKLGEIQNQQGAVKSALSGNRTPIPQPYSKISYYSKPWLILVYWGDVIRIDR